MAIIKASKELLEQSASTMGLIRDYFESVVELPSEKPYERVFLVKGVDVPDDDAEIVLFLVRENGVIRISHWVGVNEYFAQLPIKIVFR